MATPDAAHILLVDDEETFRLSTAELLRRHGHTCECAEDAEKAVALLNENESYDLLIADIRMPGNSELEFLREMQQRRPALPIIVVTGYPSVQTAVDALRLTVVDYLTKPLNLSELLNSVTVAVQKGRLLGAIRKDRESAREWGEALEHLAASLHRSGGTDGETELAWTMNRYLEQSVVHIGILAGTLKQTLDAVITGTVRESVDVCSVLRCPRMQAYKGALDETVAVLEQTKGAFKSKQLGELRQKLEGLLKRKRNQAKGAGSESGQDKRIRP